MNLRIGLTARSAGWEQLLEQTGAFYETVEPGSIAADAYSLVIVTREPAPAAVGPLKEYLRSGGAIAGYSAFLAPLDAGEPQRERVAYLLA